MRKMITVIMISFVGITSFGQQNNEKELSNAEQFSSKSGTLIQKVFYTIGTPENINSARLEDVEGNMRSHIPPVL